MTLHRSLSRPTSCWPGRENNVTVRWYNERVNYPSWDHAGNRSSESFPIQRYQSINEFPTSIRLLTCLRHSSPGSPLLPSTSLEQQTSCLGKDSTVSYRETEGCWNSQHNKDKLLDSTGENGFGWYGEDAKRFGYGRGLHKEESTESAREFVTKERLNHTIHLLLNNRISLYRWVRTLETWICWCFADVELWSLEATSRSATMASIVLEQLTIRVQRPRTSLIQPWYQHRILNDVATTGNGTETGAIAPPKYVSLTCLPLAYLQVVP